MDDNLSFESVSSIKKSNNSNNSNDSSSSPSLPIEENKKIKIMNNSAINQNNISNKNISIEIQNKNNLTTAIIHKEIIDIPKVINQTLENYYKNSLKIKFKKSINKSLIYLQSKYNFIKPYTSKGFNSKKINFQNELLELQNFKADSEQIWVASLDKNHNYLATGGKSGVVKIWKMNTLQDDDNKYNEVKK